MEYFEGKEFVKGCGEEQDEKNLCGDSYQGRVWVIKAFNFEIKEMCRMGNTADCHRCPLGKEVWIYLPRGGTGWG